MHYLLCRLTADTNARLRHLNVSFALFCLALRGPPLSAALATVVGPSPLQIEATFNDAAHASTCHLHADYLPLRISREVIDSGSHMVFTHRFV